MPREKNQQKILFVINPVSGNADKNNLESDISRLMSEENQPFEIYYTSGVDDKEKISALIKENNPAKVAVLGGDGTCNLVAQTLMHSNISMGIIPFGSANGLATELNLPANLSESLKIIIKGKTQKIDVLRFNNEFISLHIGDIGLNASVVKRFEQGKIRGFWGYGKYYIGEIGKAKPAKFQLEFNNKIKKKKAVMIAIANAARYGTGAVINPDGKPDDGYLEIIVVRPQKLIHFLGIVASVFTGKIHTLNYVDIYSCREVLIRNYEKKIVQVDGEVIGHPSEVYVETLPRALQVIVP